MPEPRSLRLHIPGRTPGQGSMQAFRARSGAVVVRHAAADAIALYRADVRNAVARIWESRPPIEEQVTVSATFLYPRPLEHYVGRNRHAALRPAYLNYGPRRPDLDKAGRALLDALVAAELLADDRLVTELHLWKRYLISGNPGTTVTIEWPA